MHQSSYEKMAGFADLIKKQRPNQTLTIVDLGSKDVNGCYKPLFSEPGWKYIGIDMDGGKNVDFVLTDPYDWPQFADASVDIIISGQTFEHAEYIWISILEMERILRPEGVLCLIAPSSGPEHRFPVDCWRIYPDGFSALGKFAGLRTLHVSTEWNPKKYSDGSATWKDSVFIAQKPAVTSHKTMAIRMALKEYIKTLRPVT